MEKEIEAQAINIAYFDVQESVAVPKIASIHDGEDLVN